MASAISGSARCRDHVAEPVAEAQPAERLGAPVGVLDPTGGGREHHEDVLGALQRPPGQGAQVPGHIQDDGVAAPCLQLGDGGCQTPDHLGAVGRTAREEASRPGHDLGAALVDGQQPSHRRSHEVGLGEVPVGEGRHPESKPGARAGQVEIDEGHPGRGGGSAAGPAPPPVRQQAGHLDGQRGLAGAAAEREEGKPAGSAQ